ncbi:YitT family protein [Marininema halotolerans]|uniref:YitT family protein n=1 Tax=Marininema halotolerans TaxID=1155944 RepID=UPI000B854ECA|nr:YitT family protein [Marininema halotolerans]
MNRVARITTIFISSILIGFAFNMFLLSHKVLSGGVSGIAMILGLLTSINSGTLIFLLNIPIFILGWMKLGKRFVTISLFSVAVTSISMGIIPIAKISEDPILSSIFGGVLVGIGTGLIFRAGGSTGGFDIVSMVLTQKKELPLGTLLFGMNAIVVFVSGFIFTWDLALYTMASIYVTGRVIDAIHTRHIKLTLMIITSNGDEVKEKLLSNLVRGITVLDGEGAYTKEKRRVLITVISRYELTRVKHMVAEVDPHSFINITQTIEVMGYFRRT